MPAGGPGGADTVLGPRALPVAQFQVRDRRVGGGAKRVSRMPSASASASVKRNWVPGCGRSLRTISRSALGQPGRWSPEGSATHAPSRRSPSGSPVSVQAGVGTFMTVCGNLQDSLVDGVGDGHADRVRQPPDAPDEPGDELVGAAAGVGAERGLASPPEPFRQLGQGQPDSWLRYGRRRCGSPRCRAAVIPRPAHRTRRCGGGRRTPSAGGARRPSSSSRWRPASRSDGVTECARASTPSMSTITCPPAAGPACRPTSRRTRALRPEPCAAQPEPAASRGQLADQAGDGRAGGRRPEHGWLGQQHAHIGQAAPARRDREGDIQEDLGSGSWTVCRLRQGASAADIVWPRPVLRIVSTSSTIPAREATPRPPSSTRTCGYDPRRLFTWEVLPSSQPTGPSASPVVAGQERFPCF